MALFLYIYGPHCGRVFCRIFRFSNFTGLNADLGPPTRGIIHNTHTMLPPAVVRVSGPSAARFLDMYGPHVGRVFDCISGVRNSQVRVQISAQRSGHSVATSMVTSSGADVRGLSPGHGPICRLYGSHGVLVFTGWIFSVIASQPYLRPRAGTMIDGLLRAFRFWVGIGECSGSDRQIAKPRRPALERALVASRPTIRTRIFGRISGFSDF